jgi:hypothetical protein
MNKLEKLKELFDNIENNNFNIYLYVPSIPETVYSMAVEEIYNICYLLRKNNYNAFLITGEDENESEFKIPLFLREELRSLPHLSPKKDNINVTPNDFLIVPEFFVNVMHQIADAKVQCEKIVLCQSQTYMLDSLPPNHTWAAWGFNTILTTSEQLKDFIQRNSRVNYNIQTYDIGVPDYFKPKKNKKPIIMYFSRNDSDIKRLSKIFFMKYPELSWVLFERVQGSENFLTREKLADKMGEIPVLLWLDKEAGFGTLPLEAMKSGAVVVGMIPEIEKDYTKMDDTAIWSSSLEILAEQLGVVIKEWMVDNIPTVVYENMTKVSERYTSQNNEKTLISAFSNILENRRTLVKNAIQIASENE